METLPRPWKKSLSGHCTLVPYGPWRHGDQDCIGNLDLDGKRLWFAFLANGYTHGPLKSEAQAWHCSEGLCDCWKSMDIMRDERGTILARLDALTDELNRQASLVSDQ